MTIYSKITTSVLSVAICILIPFLSFATEPSPTNSTDLFETPGEELVPALDLVSDPSVVRIGVVLDGPGVDNIHLLERFKNEITGITEGEFKVLFPEKKTITGNWIPEDINNAVTRLLHDPEVDMLLALGIVASHQFCCRFDISKPVVAAFVVDAEVQQLPSKGSGTGRPFLNYVSNPAPIQRDLSVFLKMVDFEKVTVLVGKPFMEAIPNLEEQFLEAVKILGLEIKLISVEESAEEALGSLGKTTEVVYFGPMLNFPQDEFLKLVNGLAERGIPSFSVMGCKEVDEGVLGGLRPRNEVEKRARHVARNVQRILRGEKAENIPIQFPLDERLCLNTETLQTLGFSLDLKKTKDTD